MRHNNVTSENAWLKALALPVLGVVYGDIGTSPLYTLRECLNAAASSREPLEPVILGVLSLIFWAIMFVVTLKYVTFIMRADNQGEGGIMALLALALRSGKFSPTGRKMLVLIGITGAALFYGDGMITPAISVLSAVEGLEIATPVFQPYVLPITVCILIMLFGVQRHGTGSVGQLFGPIMLIWFLTLGSIGIVKIIEYPAVLHALNPYYGLHYLQVHGYESLLVLGSVVLAITGAEALYADMGHFGASPIRRTWFYLVLPALSLNYFGQGATVLLLPETASNPFFMMFPENILLPVVVLATAATIIASQAVISGTYSITQQAVQLGYLPRVRVLHTSETEHGQIYIPVLNWILLISIIILVLGFGSSSRLASAYGIAVTGTMLMTTLLFLVVARNAWQWSYAYLIPLIGMFLLVDTSFLGACLLKLLDGGWLPLAIGLMAYILMSTWYKGRVILYQRLFPKVSLEQFLAETVPRFHHRVKGTSVFLAAPKEGIPNALLKNLKHNKVLHEKIIILTIAVTKRPRENHRKRYVGQVLGNEFYLIRANFGFMEMPDVPRILEDCRARGLLHFDREDTSYFVSRLRPIPTLRRHGMALWREKLFAAMRRNAAHAPDFFRIPPSQVIELDMQLEI